MIRKKILTFGELLLRISPAANAHAASRHPLMLYIGGAEANVATALAAWNVPVKYCTVLPDNFMSRHMQQYLEYKGIYTSAIQYAGHRIGVYYLERGADLKGKMVYDREHSAFSQIVPGQIDWDAVLQDVCWLHLSAISPALNANVAAVCLEAAQAASQRGITISIDLNYRARLWQYTKEPWKIMAPLVAHCHVIMGNIWSAETLLQIPVDKDIHTQGTKEAYTAHALKTSEAIMQQYPQCTMVANTFRFDAAGNALTYYTTLYAAGQLHVSKEFTAACVVDRSGSGDCFMAGLIYGIYQRHTHEQLINYATAAAVGKLQEAGDTTDQDILTIHNFAG